VSFALALGAGFGFAAAGLVRSPLLIAVILSATSLGVILPVLAEAGQLTTSFGQVVVAGASVAEVVPVVLLSVLFSADSGGIAAQLVLLVSFLLLVAAVGAVVLGAERSRRLSGALLALQETTAEIRVRAAVALLMLFAALASRFGLEAILGAFLAGVTVMVVDRDRHMTHTLLRVKLQALAYRSLAERPVQLVAAGLLQATSLSIPVVAGAIGVGLGLIRPVNYATLVAAGLPSVVVFALTAVPLLRRTVPTTRVAAPRAGSGR
jgi:hypothetical protein